MDGRWPRGFVEEMDDRLKEDFMPTATVVENPHTAEAYDQWLERGKFLAAEHNNRQWHLGGWLNEGDDEYNVKNLGIPSYLLIGSHPPNFWKDVSDKTDLAVGTLKCLSMVARRYPANKRFSNLSWSHHWACSAYERRYEYLEACLVPGEKPRPLTWLAAYIAEHEGSPEERETYSVPLYLPLNLIKKLKDVAKHRRKSVGDVAYDLCATSIFQFVQRQEREISLELFGVYEEGIWPLDPKAKAHYEPKSRRRKK